MERQKKIIDASIGVKWFAKEEGSEAAIKMLDMHTNREIEIVVPDLFLYEVVNALRFKTKSEESLKEAIELLDMFQLNIKPISFDVMKRIIRLSLQYDLTIYDATYIAFGETLNSKIITEDTKILNSKHYLIESF